ncbi:three component ABC system middle component [Pseudomonas sp. ATCC 13867]|uniref:three component ABC system middle component n=1 Tax=Pseudomonas sp. ATCC 13867 TaxID=1294143 RepID=UPI0009B76CE0|nr:three component ABC system middle component [Pseudomonas sp. ATCC 13867]
MRLTTTDHIHTLHRSPLIMAPILHAFYSDLKETQKNVLLSYLVLPFVLYDSTSSYLHRVSDRSTWRTMISDKTRIAGIHKRVNSLRNITNVTLMSLVSAGYLIIDEDMVVRATRKRFPVIKGMGQKIASARNLAKLLEEREAPRVYKSLGIVQL